MVLCHWLGIFLRYRAGACLSKDILFRRHADVSQNNLSFRNTSNLGKTMYEIIVVCNFVGLVAGIYGKLIARNRD